MERLRRLRTEKGLSQARLAARAELDPSTVNQIERGAREASPATLRKLAGALDVGIADLLEDTSPKAQAPLPLDEVTGAPLTGSLDAWAWREHCENLAGFFEGLAGRDAPPSRALGWWDVVPEVAGYTLAVVDTLLEGVQDGTVVDDEGELIPLLRAAYRLAHAADEVWGRGVQELAGEIQRASVETRFWSLTERLELTDEQREKIVA